MDDIAFTVSTTDFPSGPLALATLWTNKARALCDLGLAGDAGEPERHMPVVCGRGVGMDSATLPENME